MDTSTSYLRRENGDRIPYIPIYLLYYTRTHTRTHTHTVTHSHTHTHTHYYYIICTPMSIGPFARSCVCELAYTNTI